MPFDNRKFSFTLGVVHRWMIPIRKAAGVFHGNKKGHLLALALVGIIVWCFFKMFLPGTITGDDLLNGAFDKIVLKEGVNAAKSAETPGGATAGTLQNRLLFVDFDAQTYLGWGNPVLTPRDKLAEVIRLASEGGAKVIVLDILLEKESCSAFADEQLRRVLAEDHSLTDIVFPLRLDAAGKPIRNIYDDIIAKNPKFHYGSPYFSSTSSDNKVRNWVPFLKTNDGHLLWNIALLGALFSEGGAEGKLASAEIRIPGAEPVSLLVSGKPLTIKTDKPDVGDFKIHFSFIPAKVFKNHPQGNLFTNKYRFEEIGNAEFKDKIVVIGNSNPDQGDIHLTAIGLIPGFYIMGNIINSILTKTATPDNWWHNAASIMIDIFIILATAYLNDRIKRSLHLAFCMYAWSLIVGLLSYWLYCKHGIFVSCFASVIAIVTVEGVWDFTDNVSEDNHIN